MPCKVLWALAHWASLSSFSFSLDEKPLYLNTQNQSISAKLMWKQANFENYIRWDVFHFMFNFLGALYIDYLEKKKKTINIYYMYVC